MAGSEGFSGSQKLTIDRAVREAETLAHYEFSVFVGGAEGEPRAFAERLHATLVAPARSVLVMVDPTARVLEVVTGADVRRDLDDRAVRLVVVAMQGDFAAGDLVGGITRGLQMLAERARGPVVLHADEP